MRITGYKKEYLDRIMEINDACYEGVYRAPRDVVEQMIGVSDTFTAQIAEGDFAGDYPNDLPEKSIIGFAIVRWDNVFPYIWNIAVDPAYQGRSVGGNLLRQIIKRYTLAKQKQITLHVNAQNPAQKLYFDYGFRVKSIEKDYFKPDDGLIMTRLLP